MTARANRRRKARARRRLERWELLRAIEHMEKIQAVIDETIAYLGIPDDSMMALGFPLGSLPKIFA